MSSSHALREMGVLDGHPRCVECVAWSPCGKYIATCSDCSRVNVWRFNKSDGTVCKLDVRHDNKFRSIGVIAWSPCGKRLAVADSTMRTFGVWQLNENLLLPSQCTFTSTHFAYYGYVFAGGFSSVTWSPCSQFIATAANNTGRMDVWRIDDYTPGGLQHVQTHRHSYDGVRCMAWSPLRADGSTMLAACYYRGNDKTARAWRVCLHHTVVHELRGHTDAVMSVAWSPLFDNGTFLATGSWDCTVRVWRLHADPPGAHSPKLSRDGECLHTLRGHTDWVASVAWSPAAAALELASGSLDGTICIWRLTANAFALVRRIVTEPVRSVAWSPCGGLVVAGLNDNTARVWTVFKWMPRYHSRFPPAARELVLRIMCAQHRLIAGGGAAVPLELWLTIFDSILNAMT